MTIVSDMYHRHPTSGLGMARNFFKVRYAEVHLPQTVTRVHSSPSSHLSKDEYNPWLHFYSLTKPEQAYRNGPGMRAAFKQRK